MQLNPKQTMNVSIEIFLKNYISHSMIVLDLLSSEGASSFPFSSL